jgi:hypothetical protein
MAWQQLIGIIEEARALEREEATKIPVECPNDFTPLKEGPNGVLFCPYDGWKYPDGF